MLVGYAIGGIIVGLVALYFVSVRPVRPKLRHFKSLFDYAKYAWFGKLKSRIFNDIDILILGVFVPSAAIGVYTVAWSLSKFLEAVQQLDLLDPLSRDQLQLHAGVRDRSSEGTSRTRSGTPA